MHPDSLGVVAGLGARRFQRCRGHDAAGFSRVRFSLLGRYLFRNRLWHRARPSFCLPVAIAPPLRHDDVVHFAAFSPDGEEVVTASRDSRARIWNAQTGELRVRLVHPKPVCFACFSPDGRLILTAAEDGH
jgi:hypothetical protein